MKKPLNRFYIITFVVVLFTTFAGVLILGNQNHGLKSLFGTDDKSLGAVEKVKINTLDYAALGRVDTGAKSSSLHAEKLYFYIADGEEYISFITVDDEGNQYKINKKVHDLIQVTNTSGIPEKRYVIREKIELNGRVFYVNINLKDRSNMQFKFLIGRDLIKKGDYIVDVREDT